MGVAYKRTRSAGGDATLKITTLSPRVADRDENTVGFAIAAIRASSQASS